MAAEVASTYAVSPEQRQFYENNGYLVIKGFFNSALLNNYKQRFVEVCNGIVERGKIGVVKEPSLAAKGFKGEDLINKIQDIHFDDVFTTYMEHPRLLHLVSQFIGNDVRVMNSMLINKPPGTSSHPPHQDLFYFPFRPAEKIIAAWTAIDDVTTKNGCLYVLPKSHKRNTLYPHDDVFQESKKLYHGILDPSVGLEPRIQLEMSPGDTVFFHPLLVHGSGANVSENYRKCMTAHYANECCRYIDVKGTVQDVIVAGVEDAAKKRGVSLPFEDVWRFKSKSVQAIHSKL